MLKAALPAAPDNPQIHDMPSEWSSGNQENLKQGSEAQNPTRSVLARVHLRACDGLLLQRADPLCREETTTTSSDPEEHAATTNPSALLGVEGQEQSVRAFRRCKRENPGMYGSDGEAGGEKETRSATGGDRGEGDLVATYYQPEDLHDESEVREAPSTSSGHS
ncbi:hypothetical protein NDU88_005978 [Pleurodeles waltl]|uniref:Uncharacterized protein n=1 Tax=Pleurodeles waltl TaxID=8319 RepID=A0AAV7NSX2_PLEWA|nr:hypothetical protein NDU88_005978 [Pleurodeles waltl]